MQQMTELKCRDYAHKNKISFTIKIMLHSHNASHKREIAKFTNKKINIGMAHHQYTEGFCSMSQPSPLAMSVPNPQGVCKYRSLNFYEPKNILSTLQQQVLSQCTT